MEQTVQLLEDYFVYPTTNGLHFVGKVHPKVNVQSKAFVSSVEQR